MTENQAVALGNSGWWKDKTPRQIAMFQLFEDRLCMPFSDYHGAMEKALGRPVFTHEFASPERLQRELLGSSLPPTFKQIIEMIPEAKRILVTVPYAAEGTGK